MTRITLACAAAIAVVVSLCGCAATTEDEAAAEDPISRETAVELFQQRCDQSMLQAAEARWHEGDANGCRLILERQLHRHPTHVEARLMLADVHAAQGNIPDAENQLRWIIQENPYNPQAHHSLGLLLGTVARHEEALFHLDQAARLEPQNEFYGMSLNAAQRAVR